MRKLSLIALFCAIIQISIIAQNNCTILDYVINSDIFRKNLFVCDNKANISTFFVYDQDGCFDCDTFSVCLKKIILTHDTAYRVVDPNNIQNPTKYPNVIVLHSVKRKSNSYTISLWEVRTNHVLRFIVKQKRKRVLIKKVGEGVF